MIDTNPCIGTCGNIQWRLDVSGKPFHSGLPHKGINAIEFGVDAIAYLQGRFFEKFPRHPREEEYNFATQSTLKATRIQSTSGSINQIPGECTIEGDIRLCPFYDVATVKTVIEECVEEINANPSILEEVCIHRGPHSKYTLPSEELKGAIQLVWTYGGENGVACNLSSPGYRAVTKATEEVVGSVKPYGIGGSLPLIRELQDRGFDVQIAGYGLSSRYTVFHYPLSLFRIKIFDDIMVIMCRYHGDNEYAKLSDMRNATSIISRVRISNFSYFFLSIICFSQIVHLLESV
jgi:acetylornithine deacetylase